MKEFIFHDWGKWENVCIRVNSDGSHYLLQRRTCFECRKEMFKNRKLDKRIGLTVFHGSQGLPSNFTPNT